MNGPVTRNLLFPHPQVALQCFRPVSWALERSLPGSIRPSRQRCLGCHLARPGGSAGPNIDHYDRFRHYDIALPDRSGIPWLPGLFDCMSDRNPFHERVVHNCPPRTCRWLPLIFKLNRVHGGSLSLTYEEPNPNQRVGSSSESYL